jgi:hypothetical protein
MNTVKWTALDEATGAQYGRYDDEASARAEAARRTKLSQHAHTARQAEVQPDELHFKAATCSVCATPMPAVDNIVQRGENNLVCASLDCRRESATRVAPGAFAWFSPLTGHRR